MTIMQRMITTNTKIIFMENNKIKSIMFCVRDRYIIKDTNNRYNMNNDQCRLKMTPLLACLALATANRYDDAEKVGHCVNFQCFKVLIKHRDELDLNTTDKRE